MIFTLFCSKLVPPDKYLSVLYLNHSIVIQQHFIKSHLLSQFFTVVMPDPSFPPFASYLTKPQAMMSNFVWSIPSLQLDLTALILWIQEDKILETGLTKKIHIKREQTRGKRKNLSKKDQILYNWRWHKKARISHTLNFFCLYENNFYLEWGLLIWVAPYWLSQIKTPCQNKINW